MPPLDLESLVALFYENGKSLGECEETTFEVGLLSPSEVAGDITIEVKVRNVWGVVRAKSTVIGGEIASSGGISPCSGLWLTSMTTVIPSKPLP